MEKDRGNDTFVGPSAFYCTVNVLMGLHSGQRCGSTSEVRGERPIIGTFMRIPVILPNLS